MMNESLEEIKRLLAQVGISESDHAKEISPGIHARVFDSEYARLYILECLGLEPLDWPDIVRKVDRKVLHDVREKELKTGGVVDAHVCFVVDDEAAPSKWAANNEQLVRRISRKYWASSSRLRAELETRLTLLPVVSAPIFYRSDELDVAKESIEWLDSLSAEGVSDLFGRFESSLETHK